MNRIAYALLLLGLLTACGDAAIGKPHGAAVSDARSGSVHEDHTTSWRAEDVSATLDKEDGEAGEMVRAAHMGSTYVTLRDIEDLEQGRDMLRLARHGML